MFDIAYLSECNIEVAKSELNKMELNKDYSFMRISYAFSAGRYWSIMLECHGGY